jgi:hypothetical protein
MNESLLPGDDHLPTSRQLAAQLKTLFSVQPIRQLASDGPALGLEENVQPSVAEAHPDPR